MKTSRARVKPLPEQQQGIRVRDKEPITALPAVDAKSPHAKIGELTLENDFLEGALTKA